MVFTVAAKLKILPDDEQQQLLLVLQRDKFFVDKHKNM